LDVERFLLPPQKARLVSGVQFCESQPMRIPKPNYDDIERIIELESALPKSRAQSRRCSRDR
jgi:hypothetical protein